MVTHSRVEGSLAGVVGVSLLPPPRTDDERCLRTRCCGGERTLRGWEGGLTKSEGLSLLFLSLGFLFGVAFAIVVGENGESRGLSCLT